MPSLGRRFKTIVRKIKNSKSDSVDAPVEAVAQLSASATPIVPPFVLAHAPVVYLDKGETHWPGSPVDHLKHVVPLTADGKEIPIPDNVKGTPAMLLDPGIRNLGGSVFLSVPDARKETNDPVLTSPGGKPDANGMSTSPCFIIIVDKTQMFATAATPPDPLWDTQLDGNSVVDAFYFYFCPYNLGNKVVFQNFGNHIGDWEHNMIRFVDGTPRWMHFSAHSDGAAYTWDTVEKTADGQRPIDYAASGSHANYPTADTHAYSPVPVFGPKDHTSKGFLWDPLKNWVACNADTSVNFHPLPSEVSNLPGYNKSISGDDVWAMLAYEGRWGNSFSQLKQAKIFASFSVPGISGLKKKVKADKGNDETPAPTEPPTDPIGKLIQHAETEVLNTDDKSKIVEGATNPEAPKETKEPAAQAAMALAAASEAPGAVKMAAAGTPGTSLTLYQKLLLLIWAEGPTGPRDKSLDRRMANRWTAGVFTKLP
ncbi:hypothetical protein DL96DRAFT_1589529 [Flagelloscypha sp. PMI_526]|nr:hypothetical protein DL96DRAFT_1589529 [Flagelloscypha sp. PMI_526]